MAYEPEITWTPGRSSGDDGTISASSLACYLGLKPSRPDHTQPMPPDRT
jgi:hypothetical protein